MFDFTNIQAEFSILTFSTMLIWLTCTRFQTIGCPNVFFGLLRTLLLPGPLPETTGKSGPENVWHRLRLITLEHAPVTLWSVSWYPSIFTDGLIIAEHMVHFQ